MQQVQGFSLIEVLISLVITAIIILTLLFAQLQDTKLNSAIKFTTIANNLLINTSESLLAGVAVSSTSFNDSAHGLLPQGNGGISIDNISYQLDVYWDNPTSTSANHLTMTV